MRQGKGKCNRESEKRRVNVGQWGGGRQEKKERRKERKEVGEGEVEQWRRNDWLRTKDESHKERERERERHGFSGRSGREKRKRVRVWGMRV